MFVEKSIEPWTIIWPTRGYSALNSIEEETFFDNHFLSKHTKKKKPSWNDFVHPKWLWAKVIQKAKPQWTGSVLGNPCSILSAFDCKASHTHYSDCNWTHSLKRLSLHSIVNFHKHGKGRRGERNTHTHTHNIGGCEFSPNLSQCTYATEKRFHCLLQHNSRTEGVVAFFVFKSWLNEQENNSKRKYL